MEELTVRKIVATKKATGLQAVREKLGISLERAASLISTDRDATGIYFLKERGLCAMLEKEYKTVMAYFKKVKLQRIFGNPNPKEEQA